MIPTVELTLPVYNEEHVLTESVETIINTFRDKMKYPYQVVIADNGSTDRTPEIARNLAGQYENVSYISLPRKGRGYALTSAWDATRADIVSYMDIDLSTDLNQYPELIDSVANGYDMAVGVRMHPEARVQRSFKRNVTSRCYAFLLRFFLGFRIVDAQCGFKAVKRKVYQKLVPSVKDREWFFDTEILFHAQKDEMKVKELPVRWIEDKQTKVKIISVSLRYILKTVQLKMKYGSIKK
jgi:glycosyltransferase involved in cell wall biosynthesis